MFKQPLGERVSCPTPQRWGLDSPGRRRAAGCWSLLWNLREADLGEGAALWATGREFSIPNKEELCTSQSCSERNRQPRVSKVWSGGGNRPNHQSGYVAKEKPSLRCAPSQDA